MKKTMLLILSIILVFSCTAGIMAADTPGPTVNITAEVSSAVVWGAAANAMDNITILVMNPKGNIEYVDQVLSDSNKQYSFGIKFANRMEGQYKVLIGGDNIDNPIAKTFSLQNYEEGGGAVAAPVATAAPTPTPASEAFEVKAEDLKPGADGKVSIKLPDNKNEALFPGNIEELVGDNEVEVKFQDMSFAIPSEVLKFTSTGISTTDLKDARISLKVAGLTESLKHELVSKVADIAQANVKVSGGIFEVSLSIVAKDNKQITVARLDKPVQLTLKVDANANKKLIGVYCISDDGKLEYIGGKLSADGREMSAEINHFSKYAVLEYDKTYSDMASGYWAYETIRQLSAKHVIKGVDENRFAPEDSLTRAEFTALIVRTLGLNPGKGAGFADVKQGEWYASFVDSAYEAGLIKGRTEEMFAPGEYITREEMASLLVRAYQYKTGSSLRADKKAGFSDYAEIGDWAKDYVNAAFERGLVKGYPDGSFLPANFITRAEGAQAIYSSFLE